MLISVFISFFNFNLFLCICEGEKYKRYLQRKYNSRIRRGILLFSSRINFNKYIDDCMILKNEEKKRKYLHKFMIVIIKRNFDHGNAFYICIRNDILIS